MRALARSAEESGVHSDLGGRLRASRRRSEDIAAPLSDEDMVVQPMPDASPTKWHLAHTSWFYEAFVLEHHLPGYRRFSDDFHFCFNSYYEALGPRQPRALRGLITRPSCAEVRAYRHHVDEALDRLVSRGTDANLAALLQLGICHEEQHQELMLTDILSLFAMSPLRPAYGEVAARVEPAVGSAGATAFVQFEGGIAELGHRGDGFAYDNEGPRHAVLLEPFRIADRCVTNAEWLAFMDDGGYRTAQLWLADGWDAVRQHDWRAPAYWEQRDGGWQQMTLGGLGALQPDAAVAHISYYEADAFARWAGRRLPSEAEWEAAATAAPGRLRGLFGAVWQWTGSAYLPYPGYRPQAGAVGEYNGKFMCNQMVLRGSSGFTAAGHSRVTYRNFFYPHQRWQRTGLRLAEDAQ